MKQVTLWRKRLSSPTVIVLVLSLIFIVLSLYTAQHTRPYVSDDVSWQNILLTWRPFDGHRVVMGAKDNFIVNVPLFALLGHFFAPSRTLLFVEASAFAIINFILFYIASLYFLKRCRIKPTYTTLSPFLWLASFGYEFSQLFLNTNWRNYEPGISFIYFMLAMKLYSGEFGALRSWRSKCMLALAGVIAGIFAYSDPYFLYFTTLPIAALFIALFLTKKIPRRILVTMLAGVAVSLLAMRAARYGLAVTMGLFIPYNPGFTHLNHPIKGLEGALNNIAIIFSASTSRLNSMGAAAVATILNLALVCGVIVRLIYEKVNPATRTDADADVTTKYYRLLVAFFSATGLLIFVANVIINPFTYRYFLLFVYIAIVLMALTLGRLKAKWRRIFAAVIAAATIANLATSLFVIVPSQTSNATPNRANNVNYKVISGIERLGLTKGYVNYWDGDINTYLSGGKVEFLPVSCSDKHISSPQYLLVDTATFTKPAERSFYMIDSDETVPSACSRQSVIAQFGKPQQVAHVLNKTILIYNYDISSRMSTS